jgi:carbamoyl-phosphate synthase large subunit
VKDSDKSAIIEIGKRFSEMGFDILSTFGTGKVLTDHGIPATFMKKIAEGRPNILDCIKNRTVEILINTPSGPRPRRDEVTIRRVAVAYGIPGRDDLSGAAALQKEIKALKGGFFRCKNPLRVLFISGKLIFGQSSER